MDNEFIGAIKIKDGLFIGDEFAAQDLEFIITNKVTHIINCAGRQLANYWESLGVTYLTYNWLDAQNQIVFDPKGEVVNEIFNFIEEAHANGDSVLVHSERGQSRSCCVIAAYFMKRFRWTLYKTLEFLASRRPDLEIRDSFYYQLVNLESKLTQQVGGNVSSSWYEVTPDMDHEELLLRNTFLNARNAPLDEHLVNPQFDNTEKLMTINWSDERTNDINNLIVILNDEHVMKLKLAPPKTYVKSILKGSNKIFKLGNNKRPEDETPQSLKKSSSVSGLRMNKSLKTLHEDKSNVASSFTNSITSMKKGVIPTAGTRVIDLNEKPKTLKYTPVQSIPRSSSASHFEKEGTDVIHDNPAPLTPLTSNIPPQRGVIPSSTIAHTKSLDNEVNRNVGGGNIIHVTVNNFMAPLNNVNNVIQTTTSNLINDKSNVQTSKSKRDNLSMSSSDRKQENNNTKGGNYPTETNINQAEPYSKILTDPAIDKNSLNYLAAKQLRLAIEKKLSKDSGKQHEASLAPTNDDITSTVPSENYIPSVSNTTSQSGNKSGENRTAEKPPRDFRDSQETKIPKPKEFTRPTDMKVNYQVLLKNRETPPPRQREEAKKNPESVYKKALMKNSSTPGNKAKENINVSSSSNYLQNLFPSTIMQLNTYTPSALSTNAQNIDKRTPATTKATPSQYNFNINNPIKPTVAHHTPSNSQSFDKNFTSPNSYLENYLKSTTPNGTQNTQTYALKPQINNFIPQSKSMPVKASHEKIDRPRSNNAPLRSGTPNAPVCFNNKSGESSSSRFDRKDTFSSSSLLRANQTIGPKVSNTPSLRSFSPSLNNNSNQQVRKESPSSQTSAKFRQRSSSPGQNANYNTLFGNFAGPKPKWKF